MWNRKELKDKAKALLRGNYWRIVLVSLVMLLITGGTSAASLGNSLNSSAQHMDGIAGWILMIIAAVLAASAVAGLVIKIFLLNPLKVSCIRYLVENHKAPASLNELGYGFSQNYLNVVKTMFFQDLHIFLWSLLFVVPGVIKSYSYRMVPYLLAENADIPSKEALDTSRELMDGSKANAFVLDLSFIGWYLLSSLTFGILSVFYVNPYKNLTDCELYYALKEQPVIVNG